MFTTGLVSVSFRELTPEEIIRIAKEAGLYHVEWGSDIHAPCDDMEKVYRIADLQRQYGVGCCSYGTYFRLGVTPIEELFDYISAAKVLGTNILRLWCGTKPAFSYSSSEREELLSQCVQAAEMAQHSGVVFCLECHQNTYTQTLEGAMDLMKTVNSPAFRMYWQPNQYVSAEENIRYAEKIAPYVHHIHTFHWQGKNRLPLLDGLEIWRRYLKKFSGDHRLLLEFMPDDRPETLPREAQALRRFIDDSVD